MTIADVSAHGLSSPIDPPRSYRLGSSTREIRKRDVVLVSVETADGEIGWAPCGTGTFTKWQEFNEGTPDDIAEVIRDIVGPDLVGVPVDEPETAREVIDSTNLPAYLRWQAKSVVDIAQHDILGKRRGAPIYELLDYDVEPTPTLTAYPSSGLYLSPSEHAAEAAEFVDRGCDMYKYRAGLGVDRDRRTIDHLRETLGDDVDLMVDAHAWWSLEDRSYSHEEVQSLVEYMGDRGVYWIEEPFPSNEYMSYRGLSETTGVPLAVAEGCLEVVEVATVVVERGTPNAAPDAVTGALLADAALRASVATVRSNLERLDDQAFVEEMGRRAARTERDADRAIERLPEAGGR